MKILMLIANDDLDDCKNCIASGLNVDYGDNNDEDVSDLFASRLNKGNSDDLDTGDYDYDVVVMMLTTKTAPTSLPPHSRAPRA